MNRGRRTTIQNSIVSDEIRHVAYLEADSRMSHSVIPGVYKPLKYIYVPVSNEIRHVAYLEADSCMYHRVIPGVYKPLKYIYVPTRAQM